MSICSYLRVSKKQVKICSQIPKLLNFYRDCILKLDELIAETYQLYEVNQDHAGIEGVRSCGAITC
jgi:Zn-dependent alcohol dehydrogenase